KKREYVLETLETYPKKVFFNFFGDRVDFRWSRPGRSAGPYRPSGPRKPSGCCCGRIGSHSRCRGRFGPNSRSRPSTRRR
ncbi:MAG: DUF3127 domain-containing protein, partial [Oscillibacter sp.]|nr:DUF3127 domain-containing protein [Oscillibacter sp.]